MTYSHLHEDHYDSTRIPEDVKHILVNGKELCYKGLKIKTILTCEDKFGDNRFIDIFITEACPF